MAAEKTLKLPSNQPFCNTEKRYEILLGAGCAGASPIRVEAWKPPQTESAPTLGRFLRISTLFRASWLPSQPRYRVDAGLPLSALMAPSLQISAADISRRQRRLHHQPSVGLGAKRPSHEGMLKAEMKRRGLTYDQLAAKLAEIGVTVDAHVLRNKVSRGGFSAVFFVQCLRAMGVTSIQP